MAKLMTIFGVLSLFFMALFQSSNAAYNVVNFGARSDGRTDSTQAFQRAWASTCSSVKPAIFYVPRGIFLIRPVVFNGPCKNTIVVEIDGTIAAPADYRALGNSGFWILFMKVSRVSVHGGTIDARGAAYWACLATGKNCPTAARSITFMSSNNIVISGLTSINSQTMHVVFNTCNNVMVKNMKIIASSNSPNTDGIHIQASTGVSITSSSIRTGDDCISIGPGTKNVLIQRIACGPGHGISIGSLGNYLYEDGVQNVTVMNTIFTGTQNGVRIKSWARPSNGFATNIAFRNIIMRNVYNPIIIDQNYCPDNSGCPNQKSGVKISQVTYKNIKGVSMTPIAMNFGCSSSDPCSGIRLKDIKLTYLNNRLAATSSCNNAGGSSSGVVIPKSCL